MRTRRTTICCSAVALILGLHGAFGATAVAQLALFPVRTGWTLDLNNALTAPPVFSGPRGFFPIEDNRLVAYDIVRGTQLWIASSRLLSAPAAGDGLVFLPEPESLTALRQEDGAVAWKVPFTEPLSVPLVWDSGWLLAATSAGAIVAIRGADGVELWRHELGELLNAPPSFAADRLYLPVKDHRIVALRLETGEPLWERQLGGTPNEILALDDRVYAGSDDNFFYCLRAKDGEVDWRWRTGGDVRGRPAFDEDRVYFVSLDNVLRAMDRRSGNQRWMRPLPLRPTTGAVHAAGSIIVAGLSPVLRGFALGNGSPAGDITLKGEVAAPPHALEVPDVAVPALVIVTRDVAKGAVVTFVERSVEPATTPPAPLPNPTPLPVAPTAQ